MRKLIFIALIALSFNASGQSYELIRHVYTMPYTLQDTNHGDFTHTGTMEIKGEIVKRNSVMCISNLCLNINKTQAIVGSNDYRAILRDIDGDEYITIISAYPNIIIMTEDFAVGSVDIYEYKSK